MAEPFPTVFVEMLRCLLHFRGGICEMRNSASADIGGLCRIGDIMDCIMIGVIIIEM